MLVIRGADGDTGRGLIRVHTGREDGGTGPEVEEVLSLSLRHPLYHRPEPTFEPTQLFLILACVGGGGGGVRGLALHEDCLFHCIVHSDASL